MRILMILLICIVCLISGYKSNLDVDELLSWITSSFSSEEQAKADTNFYEIRLEMVQIWNERNDGPWIYVEQAVADFKNKPYRQRVYQLVPKNNTIKSVVYTFDNPLRFAGDYKKRESFEPVNSGFTQT